MANSHQSDATKLAKGGNAPISTLREEKPTGEQTASGNDFYKPLLGGLAWTAAGRWSAQIVSWVSTIIVIRLLSPSDFGILGMATVYLGLISMLSEFGIGSTVVYVRDLSSDQLAQINTVSVLFGIVAFGVSCAVAPGLAWFFRTPQLVWVVVVMGTGFAISAFQIVPGGLLRKEKAFKLLAYVDGCKALTQSLSTVLFAFLGLRYWSLVAGGLLASLVAVLLTLLWRRESFAWPRLESIKRALVFSRDVIISRISWYAYSNADFVVAGRVLGRVPLGAYTVAWSLSSTAIEKVTDLISHVTPSFFSEAQTDPPTLRRYLRNLTQGISLFTFPATLGLALVAREFVPLVLGTKWMAAIVPLQLLAIYGFMRSITTVLGPILTAIDVRWASRYGLLFVVVFPTAFYIGSHWGTVGIAAGWVCFYPLMYIPIYRHTFQRIGMNLSEYMGALWPALSGSLVMTVVVFVLKLALPTGISPVLQLGGEIVSGGASYVLTLATLHRERFMFLIRTLRSLSR